MLSAYPGVLAKRLLPAPERQYKHDNPRKQTSEQLATRNKLFSQIINGDCIDDYGFVVEANPAFAMTHLATN